ncbi:NUDIX family protein [Babesia ovis]|uniref:NUDIX family protein n=1 Tax=Babesia ovis TaxID=5869 RepID=A0A9W5TAP9_BABOV|nr:NUDIX family protein [Babesia ovis]
MSFGPFNPGEKVSADALSAHLKRALGVKTGSSSSTHQPTEELRRNPAAHVTNIATPRTAIPTVSFPGYAPQRAPSSSHPHPVPPTARVYDDPLSLEDDSEVSLSRQEYLKRNGNVNPEVLDRALLDCYGRFVALLPEEVLRDHVHLCFYLRDAYWWYCDKWVVRHPLDLCPMKFGQFLSLVCQDCALLRSFVSPEEEKELLNSWQQYNRSIPLRGGILINETCDKVLMVQSYTSKHWTFPRGKIDEEELDTACAAREIMEEIGMDVSGLIHPDAYIECQIEGRSIKLFFIPGVSENANLQPKTDYEIRSIKWVSFKLLNDVVNKRIPGFVTFHVKPFVRGIIELVQEFRSGNMSSHFPVAYKAFVRSGGTAPHRMLPPLWVDSSSKGDTTLRYMDDHCYETFGESSGWSADEMFRVNHEKFGVESTYTDQSHNVSSAAKKQRELIPFNLD